METATKQREYAAPRVLTRPRLSLVRPRRRELTPAGRVVKRSIDIIGSCALLLVAAPLLVLSALLVKATSRGPVFFRHLRCGQGSQPFWCLKLRTMVADAEGWLERDGALRMRHRQNGFKLPHTHDPRVTWVGRLLRAAHLDELPQLINVLWGDMSLIGPRPIVPEELDLYGEKSDELLSMKPGIFGAWTAQGRKRVSYPDRIDVELGYVRRASLLTDLKILLLHIPVLVRGQR